MRKTMYNERVWLTQNCKPTTDYVVLYDDDKSTSDPEYAFAMSFVEISDGDNTVVLTNYDASTMKAYKDKLQTLYNSLGNYLAYLNKIHKEDTAN